MKDLLARIAVTAGVAALASGGMAAYRSRRENGHATPPINAISHIAWDGPPPRGTGSAGRNFFMGSLLHAGASGFWASFFEILFGRVARKDATSAWISAAAVSAAAFITDYGIVSRRFRPGYEAYLSKRSLFAVYLALAAGFVAGARLRRSYPAPERRPARGT